MACVANCSKSDPCELCRFELAEPSDGCGLPMVELAEPELDVRANTLPTLGCRVSDVLNGDIYENERVRPTQVKAMDKMEF